ncbi:MAG: DUF4864 domain-containing protein [Alphaproteobacteria bacterium]|nr:DUF4864 domain-containing protein [Alphaproteobacteria bacterium]
MKRLLGNLLTLLLVASCAVVADKSEAPGRQFQNVIKSQIEAFARDDGEAAFAHSAPAIQQQLGSPGAFMAMVRTGFRPVYRPRSVEFEEHIKVDGNYAQPVRIVGPDGKLVLAMYHMQQQLDGSWRIAGVMLRPLQAQEI